MVLYFFLSLCTTVNPLLKEQELARFDYILLTFIAVVHLLFVLFRSFHAIYMCVVTFIGLNLLAWWTIEVYLSDAALPTYLRLYHLQYLC